MYQRHRSQKRALLEALEERRLLSTTSIWTPAATAPEWPPDARSVELGVKFQASVDGYVEGVRFLKGVDNIGVHTGHLWDAATGQLLASVTFTNESPSGWQEADFASPVAIQAGHTYIVSYFAPVGEYSYTWYYFTGHSATSTDGLLTALASGTDGPNGVFAYGTTSSFPSSTYEDLNYWVDVVFSQTPDHAPTAISLSNNSVPQQQPAGTLVGSLGTSDPDPGDTFTYTLDPGPGGADNASFQIVGNQLQTAGPLNFASQSTYAIRVRSTDSNGLSTVQLFTVNLLDSAQVLGRYLFYGGSSFDTSDDAAIAPDKSALLPGQTASFSNYSSYDRGINGIMIDVSQSVQNLTPSDFNFLVGNNDTPSGWSSVLTAPTITIRPGAGVNGSTRIELTWPDHTIQNQWLQVTMLANADTQLSSPDTFYFGNAIGEIGDSPTDAKVTVVDQIAVRLNSGPAGITDVYDINRDGIVDAADEQIILTHNTNVFNALNLISVPSAPAAPAANFASPAGSPLLTTLATPSTDTSAIPSSASSPASLPVITPLQSPLSGPLDSDPNTGLILNPPTSQPAETSNAGPHIGDLPAIHLKAPPESTLLPPNSPIAPQDLPILPKTSHAHAAGANLQPDIGTGL